jgi:L-aminopeptidase/D-esterase-like protein
MIQKAPPGTLLTQVGHWTHPDGMTGCTVVLCEGGATASGEVRGAAPGTRETDLLRPGGLVSRVHAILLAGGSAPGLAAADGVVAFLRARQVGHPVGPGVTPVPIVPGAVVFDRGAVAGVFPDASAGALACEAAGGSAAGGAVGAGAGATVGKALGPQQATDAGVGRAAVVAGGITAEALMVVNAFGEVRDPETGQIVAGIRGEAGFVPTMTVLAGGGAGAAPFNTVIGVVAVSLPLDVASLSVLCRMANAGLCRVITPAHTLFDGDTLFALSLPGAAGPPTTDPARLTLAGALAAEAVARAVLDAVGRRDV